MGLYGEMLGGCAGLKAEEGRGLRSLCVLGKVRRIIRGW